ncbi:MAG: ATP-binding protein [Pseudomonadota bacterium]
MADDNPVPMAWDEASRLDALQALRLLDTPPEWRFDRLTKMVSETLKAPIVLVSLVDKNRQWFKSRQGLDALETPRNISFCTHAILQDDIFVVEDALADPQFADNPLVTGAPFIRFYAGKPLYTAEGKKIGTLCVIDTEPRALKPADRDKLNNFAAWAEREVNVYSAEAESLSRLENRLRLAHLLEHAAEGMLSAKLDGTIDTVNPAACTIFRYTADQLVGMKIEDLVPPSERPKHRAFIAYLQSEGAQPSHSGLEATGLRKGGEQFPMEVSFKMLDVGSHKSFTGIVRDITERKHQERIKSEFIASVSHELRTPLTSILGALGMLQDEGDALTAAETGKLVGIAYSNGRRLNALINDVLDVEKLDAGMVNFDSEQLDVAKLLDEVCSLNLPYAAKLSVRLECVPPAAPMRVRADESRLLQVLTNLISNACKFSPAEASVQVSAERDGQWVRINVLDHGSGIPDEFRPSIFQRFAQAQASRHNKKVGTGLGLSLSKSMIEKMGGRIDFESIEGQGARFYVELPLSS